MELLLNLAWLTLSIGLGILFITSRRRIESARRKCVHAQLVAWVSYVILIALLLPAISMTDDLMAMVAPTDGEQIARRLESSAGPQHHANLHVALFHSVRDGLHAPEAVMAGLASLPALDLLTLPPRQLPQGRAPPTA